jgi:hypothetical protein
MRVSPIDSKVITSYSPSRALSVSSAFKTALYSTEHGVLSLISAAFAGIAAVNAIAAAAIVAMVLVGMAHHRLRRTEAPLLGQSQHEQLCSSLEPAMNYFIPIRERKRVTRDRPRLERALG